MTTIAEKLSSGGAETHFYGKWHVGQRSPAHLPHARGFSASLGYLTGAENHFTQVVADPDFGDKVDLWEGDGPAPNDVNGTYGTLVYARAGVNAIKSWAARSRRRRMVATDGGNDGGPSGSARLFVVMAWQNTHAPLQVPTMYCYNATGLGVNGHCPAEAPPGWPANVSTHSWCYCYDNENITTGGGGGGGGGGGSVDSSGRWFHRRPWHRQYPVQGKNSTLAGDNADRHTVEAMAAVLDEGIANVTGALKAEGFWNRTLYIVSSDNGGPVNAAQGSGNNYPLRGGKHTDFEGGVRLLAFVSGGVVPPSRRGAAFSGLIHLADWYATFCTMWGVDPTDTRARAAGLPAVDGVDVWPALISAGTGAINGSPRTEVPITINAAGCFFANGSVNKPCTLIVEGHNDATDLLRLWKAVGGPQNGLGFWTGPRHPNASIYDINNPGCPDGCLFEVGVSDPTEHVDLLHPASSAPPPNASILARWSGMVARMNALSLRVFDTNYTGAATECISDRNYYKALWGCHRGPACFPPGGTPPLPPNSTDPVTGIATCSVHL